MRCGTTTLSQILGEMPDIYMSEVKEVHFFDDRNGAYQQGIDHYASYFQKAKENQLCGECTPEYLALPECCQRISEVIPEVKLIVILRDPIIRAYSHYRYTVMYSAKESLSFEEALDREKSRLESGNYWDLVRYSYRKRGEYIDQLMMYESLFSKDQILVLFLEELTANPDSVILKIRSHLGLDNLSNFKFSNVKKNEIQKFPKSLKLHQTAKYLSSISGNSLANKALRRLGKEISKLNLGNTVPLLDSGVKNKLRKYYSPYNDRLSEWLGYSVPWK